ncbi:MAG: 2-hydroxy-3-oxopropionate reductase [Candidatus Thermofonsia Clade 1 bacterium]|jgi:2-hydroxy-3-oxopropionate reductase|uniref:2-hydroxy-3-oxopropionate reductase n=1 Tax=Candidatus Thermofonsia Clade 1 bacterium TaxID=2364210 RepID=A0A2M8PGA5_9CHLR|nr:MAG: 2-hydroxy-3-oxopropionate reductase [Candidatus Thermofonsia Clade 1 bacterium]RMF49288.1 MAG: NAD(P)-dependent oxidoreductase [Chloroflexota bacterium]
MLRVGYIGLGLMGAPIVRNLLRAGFQVVVHNRSRAIVDELAAEGAIAAHSPAEVARQVDVICTNLPDSTDVAQVVLGANGVIEGAHGNLIFMDNSTIKPETARMLAQALALHGVPALDAPCSGGQVGAQQGTLVYMVGGDYDAFQKVTPIFQATGKAWTYVGASGAGQIAKACNQIMVAAQMVAMGELLVLAQKAGVDPFKVVEAIRGGAAQCWTLDNKPQRLAQGIRTPGFKARMQLKDLNIVLETGKTYEAPLPLTEVTAALFRQMVESGNGDLDNAAVLSVLERIANVRIGQNGS